MNMELWKFGPSFGSIMPFVNMKKASSQAGGGKSFAVRVTTMDAELEFSYIEVCTKLNVVVFIILVSK